MPHFGGMAEKNELILRLSATFSSNLKAKRKALRLTQEELAGRVPMDARHYRRIEKGTALPSVALGYLLAQQLGTVVEELFEDKKL